jgi:hypothetical protein
MRVYIFNRLNPRRNFENKDGFYSKWILAGICYFPRQAALRRIKKNGRRQTARLPPFPKNHSHNLLFRPHLFSLKFTLSALKFNDIITLIKLIDIQKLDTIIIRSLPVI